MTNINLHKEDCPPLESPLWIVCRKGSASLDEQGDQNLRAVQKEFHFRIGK